MVRILLLAAFTIICFAPAAAADLTTTMMDPAGKLIPDELGPKLDKKGPCGDYDCLTIGLALYHAMLTCDGPPACTEEHPNGEQKYERWKIATTIRQSPNDVHLKHDQWELARKLVGELYVPSVIGPVFDAIEKAEGQEVQEKKK